jgi:hypothetical protein
LRRRSTAAAPVFFLCGVARAYPIAEEHKLGNHFTLEARAVQMLPVDSLDAATAKQRLEALQEVAHRRIAAP